MTRGLRSWGKPGWPVASAPSASIVNIFWWVQWENNSTLLKLNFAKNWRSGPPDFCLGSSFWIFLAARKPRPGASAPVLPLMQRERCGQWDPWVLGFEQLPALGWEQLPALGWNLDRLRRWAQDGSVGHKKNWWERRWEEAPHVSPDHPRSMGLETSFWQATKDFIQSRAMLRVWCHSFRPNHGTLRLSRSSHKGEKWAMTRPGDMLCRLKSGQRAPATKRQGWMSNLGFTKPWLNWGATMTTYFDRNVSFLGVSPLELSHQPGFSNSDLTLICLHECP
jgi:hypothetical protein